MTSSHVVPSATGLPVHTPPWQVSAPVQVFASSQVVPSATAVPRHTPPWHASGPVQALPSSQALPSGLKASPGQETLVPVHVSATSHVPAAARQTVPAAASG